MGMYLNPGNSGFSEMIASEYVDKTGLIAQVNRAIGTKQNLFCVSRPRRFGKSYAAQMLCAYYDKTCASGTLFHGYEIEKDESYPRHLNQYDVIYLDMSNLAGKASPAQMLPFLQDRVSEEILEAYPSVAAGASFDQLLLNAVSHTGNKFVMIIDEWDVPIRETPEIEKDYLRFLRMLFKSSATTSKIFAAAYMTGILPIKKDGSQSAISDFQEYTIIRPRNFGRYLGFTEGEVRRLCTENGVDFQSMKAWYDGYSIKGVGSVYNPNSVMQAIQNGDFDSYWTETSAAGSLMHYIKMDYQGLAKTVAELIGGVDVAVDTKDFANDLLSFKSRDDVLTLLIHLGYLAYDAEKRLAHIPNEEIKQEFQRSIHYVENGETIRRLQESERLFLATVQKDEDAVAAQIEKVHGEETAPLHYNREDSLRSVIKLAYYTYRDHYLQWEELPAGEGYADIVYLPKRDAGWPALLIELKWNKSADGAIAQILKKKYPEALQKLGCPLLLVGINYDKDAPAGERKHQCRIVEV